MALRALGIPFDLSSGRPYKLQTTTPAIPSAGVISEFLEDGSSQLPQLNRGAPF
jgi:hypothetical protein